MKKISLFSLMLVISVSAFAKKETPTIFNVDRKMCKASLVKLINIEDSSAESIEKNFVGINTETGKECKIKFKVYAPNGSEGTLTLDVENGLFFPFNHNVNLTNDCEASNKASGKLSFRADGGWRHRYTTTTKIEEIGNNKLNVIYLNEGSGIECEGSIID